MTNVYGVLSGGMCGAFIDEVTCHVHYFNMLDRLIRKDIQFVARRYGVKGKVAIHNRCFVSVKHKSG